MLGSLWIQTESFIGRLVIVYRGACVCGTGFYINVKLEVLRAGTCKVIKFENDPSKVVKQSIRY